MDPNRCPYFLKQNFHVMLHFPTGCYHRFCVQTNWSYTNHCYCDDTCGTLELWEYIPQTITAKSGSSSGSGKSGGGAASNLKAGYKSYLSNERGKSPARDDADATAAMNKVTAMPY